MTDAERGFISAIIADPDDDTARLVYADWLDENDEPERAELIRVQCELARRIDMSLEPARSLRKREEALTHVITGPLFGRAGRLLPDGLRYAVHHGRHGAEDIFGTGFGCRRGFPFRWRCDLPQFVRDAPVAFGALPITAVELVDRAPLLAPGVGRRAWLAEDTMLAQVPDDCRVGPLFPWIAPTPGYADNLRVYESYDLARDALSAACVAYGRSLAGLPPLPTGTTGAP